MKVLVRSLKAVLILFGILFVLLLGVLGILMIRPELFINDATLSRVSSLLENSGTQTDWKDLEVEISSESLSRKTVKFEFQNFCFDHQPPERPETLSVRACFEHIQILAKLELSRFPPEITAFPKIILRGGEVGVDVQEPKEQAGTTETKQPDERFNPVTFSPADFLPGFMQEVEVGQVEIEVPDLRFSYKAPDQEFTYKGAVELHEPDENGTLSLDFRLRAKKISASGSSADLPESLNADLELSAASRKLHGPWSVSGKLGAKQMGAEAAAFQIEITQKKERLKYKLNASLQMVEGSIQIETSGSHRVDPSAITRGKLELHLEGFDERLSNLDLQKCQYSLRQKQGELTRREQAQKFGGELKIGCDAAVTLALGQNLNVTPEVPVRFEIPEKLDFSFFVDLQTAYPPSPSEPVKGSLGATLEPARSDLLTAGGNVLFHVDGVPMQFPEKGTLSADVDVQTELDQFQALVQQLKDTPYAIPAPLNVLKGKISFGVNGTVEPRGGSIPVSLRTDLSSADQKFVSETSGNFVLSRKQSGKFAGHLDADILLQDVQLMLPHLERKPPPNFIPDARIKRGIEAEAAAERLEDEVAGETQAQLFTYNLTIQTPQRPVRLLSNLAAAPVPVFLNLVSSTETPLAGQVRIQNFPVALFEADARVRHFLIELSPGDTPDEIDGLLSVKHTDYTIFIAFAGTAQRPQIQMYSEPPLPQDQLLSTLLFGEPAEELDPGQRESVGNVEAALASRAVNLATLFFISLGPVQSVGYDSQTKNLTAKIRLGEGTSLNIGAGAESEIALRKRLGAHWAITTGVSRIGDIGEQTFTAFLEWVNRY